MNDRGAGVGVHDDSATIGILRPEIRGRFLFAGGRKFFVRGVTYGPFGPHQSAAEYPDNAQVRHDFAQMAAAGINAVRTYTVPPLGLLELAAEFGLRVMVGLPWEQHVTFLDDRTVSRESVRQVRLGVRAAAKHPAILCFTVGNEIPSSIVRWHGAARIARFIRTLYQEAKAEDPSALVTYANYPTTEYLQLPFLDLVSFNIYLQSSETLSAYLSRLMNLAGDRPLLVSEIGMDSRRNGLDAQALTIDKQIRAINSAGCAGTFLFAWTDEWHRGGFPIEDWDFGLTERDRTPKPALAAAAAVFSTDDLAGSLPCWPRFSVVLCTHNGQRYIDESLTALGSLNYPDYELIVVDDGSTDGTAAIASRHTVRLIQTENRGLSAARNVGLHAATGDIVAYIDDDAYPDPDWLNRLALVFMRTDYAGVGGPNIPPPGDSLVAQCVAHAPGGPIHVLLTDCEAEHIPGCNMAFWRSRLLQIGGFDPQFRAAGDDVDVCWRIQMEGWKLGFSPAATVFHHRRDTLRAYWKQQVGYGKAEAILERKWPDKYNAAGYLTWVGHIYNANGLNSLSRGRIYQGTWGTASYQRLYEPSATFLTSLPLLPEWYLVIAFLTALSVIGAFWEPLLLTVPLLTLAGGLSLTQAVASAVKSAPYGSGRNRRQHLKALGISTALYLMQPLARLCGRFKYGLHPWRHRGELQATPRRKTVSIWSETHRTPEEWLRHLHASLRSEGTVGFAGGGYDAWDFEVQGGMLGAVRTLIAVEDHGAQRQMARFRIWPRCSTPGLLILALLLSISAAAGYDDSWWVAALLFGAGATLGLRMAYECAFSMHKLTRILNDFKLDADNGLDAAAGAKSVALYPAARNS